MTKSKYDTHTSPLFTQRNILTLDNIHSLQIRLFLYSFENGTHLDFFQSMFAKNSQFHSYPTRDCNNFRPEFCRTNTKQSGNNGNARGNGGM